MRSVVALALLAVLAGCASAGERSSFGPYASTRLHLRFALASPQPYLYVASPATKAYRRGAVAEYQLGSVLPIRTIVAGINDPRSLAFDRAGNLYVANAQSSTVTVYAPGATTPSRTIRKGIDVPRTVAFSRAGNLFVANEPSISGDEPGSVAVFSPTGIEPLRTITKGIDEPNALAFDAEDHLYVANLIHVRQPNSGGYDGDIAVYAQGGNAPLRRIVQGINTPSHLAFDSRGRLYVSNYGSTYAIDYPAYNGDVTAYSSKRSKLLLTISAGIGNPNTLAIDSQDVLYVSSNYTDYDVTEYQPGSTTPIRTIPSSATALLVDGNDNLYAAQFGGVNVYAPGAVTPTYTINQSAYALALGNL